MIGRKGTLTTAKERLTIPVKVLDVRQAYGRTEVLVEPVGGSGKAWVEAKRLSLS